MLKIRPIEPMEIPTLKDFAPPDWSSDLSIVFAFHFGQPYFHPIVAELDGKLVGCAQGILTGKSGWLGNIIVLPEYRGRGIGHTLTADLIEFFRSRGCTTQILAATALGEPVYRKLGFRTVTHYILMKREATGTPVEAPGVRKFVPGDASRLFTLDRAATGEERQPLLSRFLEDAWVHQTSSSEGMDGFFLPGMGHGPVLAWNDRAGLALLRFKLGMDYRIAGLPETNIIALECLQKAGFQETRRAPRMLLGEDIYWQPERVYNRASGFCG
jgi:ribosomal protein S18 acetylase RimI-like enzyme